MDGKRHARKGKIQHFALKQAIQLFKKFSHVFHFFDH